MKTNGLKIEGLDLDVSGIKSTDHLGLRRRFGFEARGLVDEFHTIIQSIRETAVENLQDVLRFLQVPVTYGIAGSQVHLH